MSIKNCKSCGKVFADPVRDICRDCYYAEEEAFQTVYRFITKKKNREATITEIVKATGVEEELIIKFMKQNRLRASQFPKLAYPCESCGVDIVEGRLCESCKSSIQRDLKIHEDITRIKQEMKDDREPVYYTINKEKRK